MTETERPRSVIHKSFADQISSAAIMEASLKRGSSLSIGNSDATVGVTLDRLGDWTITVRLSPGSDRFQRVTTALEALGFFQATENEGATYMLWTSVLSGIEDGRSLAEETFMGVLKVLRAPTVPRYIG